MSNEAELGLRERKKRAVRLNIRRQAIELVADRGICSVSIEDIASAAGVSPRTFFNYFPSKEDAIFTPAEDRLDAAADLLANGDGAGGPMAVVREALLDMMDERKHDLTPMRLRRQILDRDPALIGSFLRASESTQRHWVAALTERFADERDLPSGFIELVVGASWAATAVALSVWSAEGQVVPLIDVLRRQLDQLAMGLNLPPPVNLTHRL